MSHLNPTQLAYELERRVQTRTGRRVKNLAVELDGGRVILRGQTATYYVKQLAQHGVWDLLPGHRLENSITVAVPEMAASLHRTMN